MTIMPRPPELTLSNWDLGGIVSAWSYRHTDQLFAVRPLVPGSRAEVDTMAEVSTDPADLAIAEFAELAEQLRSGLVDAITVLVGGRPAVRWSMGSASVPHLLMSVSKVVASLAVGVLVDQDRLRYLASVRDYLPELGEQWRHCRLQDVLDMASGVVCPEVGDPGAYRDPSHPFYRFEASLGWRPAQQPSSPYELTLGFQRLGRPGTRYEYTSVNTFLLAWVVERVTGLDYVDAVQSLVWDHLALDNDAAFCVNGRGTAVAHGGLIMTVDDLARFGTLFTPSGASAGHRLAVPASYASMLRRDRHELVPSYGEWPHGAHPAGQWNLVHADGDMIKTGFGGQGLYVSPTHDVVIAFSGVPDAAGRTNSLAALCRSLVPRCAERWS
ncbi:serine hydrolase domain-containing protein [Microlunatus soli]|uniref:Beta-lactamase-related domain-containing protein n=1 Tax=Microlunatus soli TaxID=630515 RepID=A0A1H1Z9W6_9ACTN|nr:serine hydrolase domain-containing protein [Microlunatus soli]SDT30478.1 hypothetical protein SAMN04489812_5083 [Microlunatus soli]